MSRININLPEKSIYHHQFSVRIDDINYGGHMSNDAVLRFAHETRLTYLKSVNHSEADLLGKSLIMSDAAVVYKGEAFHGDLIDGYLYLSDLNPYGFDFLYLFKRGDKEIARAKTGLVFFDYGLRKISKAPDGLDLLFKAV
ncbi:MAG: thioesterase family protein [Bacteriovoracales bacterium]